MPRTVTSPTLTCTLPRANFGLATETSFAQEDTNAYPTGSFLWVPAGAVHFDGANEDTVLIGTATGPWDTRYVNAE